MEDLIDEELQIMDEQAEHSVLSGEAFNAKLSEMPLRKVYHLDESASIQDVVSHMQLHNISSTVLTKNGKVSGIFTEHDLLVRVIGHIFDWNTSIATVMTAAPQTLRLTDSIAYVVHNMLHHTPVVDTNDCPIAMVSLKDINRFLLETFQKEVTNITDRPYRGVSERDDA